MESTMEQLKKDYSGPGRPENTVACHKKGENKKSKKAMQPHLMRELTQRDWDILQHLSYGPSNVNTIGRLFFQRKEKSHEEDGDGSKVNVNGQHVKKTSKYAYERLKQMVNEELIHMKKFGLCGSPICAINQLGAQEVVTKYGLDLENIKCALPKKLEIKHDLMVASSLRRIVLREALKLKLYAVNWYDTEYLMRRTLGRAAIKGKKTHFPDFAVEILTPKNGPKIIYVEVDAGTMGRTLVFDKLASFKDNAVFIVEDAARMDKLFKDLSVDVRIRKIDPRKGIIRLPSNILFVLWEDFATRGFRSATFKQFPSGDMVMCDLS